MRGKSNNSCLTWSTYCPTEGFMDKRRPTYSRERVGFLIQFSFKVSTAGAKRALCNICKINKQVRGRPASFKPIILNKVSSAESLLTGGYGGGRRPTGPGPCWTAAVMEVCTVSIMAQSQISRCGTRDCNKAPG